MQNTFYFLTFEEGGFQEVVIYQFTEEGRQKANAYKKLVKDDLERSKRLIEKIMKDNLYNFDFSGRQFSFIPCLLYLYDVFRECN